MKIAMVSEHASPLAAIGGVDAGGQNVHVAALASALADRGHRVTVFTRRDGTELPERVRMRRNVVVEHLDAGPPRPIGKDHLREFVPELARDLAARLDRLQPAVVHGHFWMSGLAAVQAARDLDVAVVQTFHALGSVKKRMQGAADTSPRSRLEDERGVARDVDRIVASCTDEVRELMAMGAHFARIDVVPSGVDTSRFRPDGVVAPRTRRPRLLVVGRLVPRKGVDDAIATLRSLPDAELVVAGGPDARELAGDAEARRLQALAEQFGVAGRVRMVGQVPHTDLPALIRSADVVLCLPWYEPFGIVALEAMACGVPVVGTAVGGLLDTVQDGRTGALLPPRQPEAAARAVAELLADDERRRQFGAAGRLRATKYTWDRVAAMTERTYLRAVDQASAAPAVRHPGFNVSQESVG
jgi:glycosyltransferase involved in cell wall biosynthesis